MDIASGWTRLLLVTLAVVFAAPVPAAEDAAARLLRDLLARESFRKDFPLPNREIDHLEYLGPIRLVDFAYTRTPDSVPRVPQAIGTTVAANCDPESTLVVTGEVAGSRTESASLTTTRGWQVGGSVSFDIGFPLVGKTNWTFSASYSESTARTDETNRSTQVTRGFQSPVLPLTEHDIQLVVFEERVDGLPYRLDLEMEGEARVHHRLERLWMPRNELRGRGFIGGREPVGDSVRELPICRAFHRNTTHPGKVVAGFCNITWAGEEIRKSRYEVLVNEIEALRWDENTYTDGQTNEEFGLVAGTEPYRTCNPNFVDYQECRERDPNEGKLYVCAARYRDGWHPGKLVIRDCMIGYGGREIQVPEYRILTYRDASADFEFVLSKYLPRERLIFTVEGEFEGVAASSGQIVRGAARPVSETLCTLSGGFEIHSPGAAVPRSPESAQRQSRAHTRALPDRGLIDGTVIVRGELDNGGLTDAQYLIRQLEPQTPPLFGDDVLRVQQALAAKGWPVRPDGFYGPLTVRSVRAFQRAHGIEVDGIVGGATLFWLGLSDTLNPVGSRDR